MRGEWGGADWAAFGVGVMVGLIALVLHWIGA